MTQIPTNPCPELLVTVPVIAPDGVNTTSIFGVALGSVTDTAVALACDEAPEYHCVRYPPEFPHPEENLTS